MKKLMIPCLYLQSEKAVTGFGQRNLFGDGDVEKLARFYSDNGADELLVFDFSVGDREHDAAIGRIRDICYASEIWHWTQYRIPLHSCLPYPSFFTQMRVRRQNS